MSASYVRPLAPSELALIQYPPIAGRAATPLVLVHDGGGTIFQYFLLEDLNRQTYGIPNPWFDSERPFTGTMYDLASSYTTIIRRTFHSKQRILLGGWSFGGLLSLEIASQLKKQNSSPYVAGLVLIDSMFPGPSSFRCRLRLSQPSSLQLNSTTALDISAKVHRCFKEAERMVLAWNPEELCRDLDNGTSEAEPPVALLRAMESVFEKYQGRHGLDFYRESEVLGWDVLNKNLVRIALNVPGNHFSVFNMENIKELSARIRQACVILDSYGDDKSSMERTTPTGAFVSEHK